MVCTTPPADLVVDSDDWAKARVLAASDDWAKARVLAAADDVDTDVLRYWYSNTRGAKPIAWLSTSKIV